MKDKVTGFSGVVTGIVYYLSGCTQALLAPPVALDGKLPDSQWYDVQRLIYTHPNAEHGRVVLNNDTTPGCDAAPPKR
jgi:hypothetical protein